jgi:hypothetical protein
MISQNPVTAKPDDFAPLPTYKETTIANQSYVNVTLTRVDPDGSTTQTSTIVSKK